MSPGSKPSLSIVVLTYKRQDELIKTLGTLQCQRTVPVEIIVVNNHPDDTGRILAQKFPQVCYMESNGNIGCEARNIAVAKASADIVITIDNDVHMKDADFVEKVLDFFRQHERAGCVNFMVLKPDGELSLRDWCHPRDFGRWKGEEFQTDHISEGASAFRRDAFMMVGGYFAPFFIGHEGPDLCLRIMKADYEIWYSPAIKVLHFASNDARPDWRAYYYNTRNNIWLAYRHYPAWYALQYVGYYTGMMLFYAIKSGHVGSFLKGVADGVRGLATLAREVVRVEDMMTLKAVHALKPSFISKIRKHLLSKQSYR